jgi:hypothetical protein
LSRASLALVRGDGYRSEVTLGMAVCSVRYWERTFERAASDLAIAADGPDRDDARRRFDLADVQLEAALNRRDRVIAELGGDRWLWVAGEGRLG